MRLPALVLLLTGVLLSGCAGAATAEPETAPSGSPRQPWLVARTTVIDSGRGPHLCLGVVQLSSPPQCSGVPVVSWKWPKGSDKEAGVRFGSYSMVGSYDGTHFTLAKIISDKEAARYFPPEVPDDFSSPCPPPKGGWRAPDPRRATDDDQERVFMAAERLAGYSTAWIDDRGRARQRPVDNVINVRVTTDVQAAIRKLREVWGGSLCVTEAEHSKAELMAVQEKLPQELWLLSSGMGIDDRLDVEVVYDDGRLQRRFDGDYGRGVVRVTSALQPYSG